MEPNILKVRLFEAKQRCESQNKPCFIGFLSEEEAAFAKSISAFSDIVFYGGTENSERVFAGFFPYGIEPAKKAFPIKSIAVAFRKTATLSHRDFLGAVLSLGIKREAVGDILIEEGRALIFVSSSVAPLILSELKTVGREGVTLKENPDITISSSSKREQQVFTVSSLRLDCVVAAICSLSRNSALEIIEQKMVKVNSLILEKPTKIISEGDKISVRGKGKFSIKSLNGETKKGRLKITVEKYGGNK